MLPDLFAADPDRLARFKREAQVLDFGLAKALSPPEGGHYVPDRDVRSVRLQPDLSMSPTITSPAATRMGMILGTAAYMSPEQARGKTVDKRSDIWAFGCVLYEMLTSRRAFGGDEITDTLAEVLKGDVDFGALPADTPSSVRRLLRRCLTKEWKNRQPEIGTARLELDEAHTSPRDVTLPSPPPVSPLRRMLPVAVTGLLSATLAAWAVWELRPTTEPSLARFSVTLPPDQQFTATARH